MLQLTNPKPFLNIKSYSTFLLLNLRVILGTKKHCLFNFQVDNSCYLYFPITNRYFSISQLNCQNIKIGRIDIQYIRLNKINDIDVDKFLEKSLQVLKDWILQRDENDNIQTLAIGKCENAFYKRIYKYF